MVDRERSNSPLKCGNHQPDHQQQISIGGGGNYEIKVQGHLDVHWSDWLDGLAVAHNEAGYTLLTGHVPDQAALHGILVKIRDLGLPIVSLARVDKVTDRKVCDDNGR